MAVRRLLQLVLSFGRVEPEAIRLGEEGATPQRIAAPRFMTSSTREPTIVGSDS